MLRIPLTKLTNLPSGRFGLIGFHTSNKLHQELIEVFIDDQPVMVPPGTTVLQV